MPLQDFIIEDELGRGSFGTVHRCRRKVDGKVYAIKQVSMEKLKQKDRVNALNEIRILASLCHPNIIEYKEAFYDEASSKLCVVMEFADGGDLESKIKSHFKKGTQLEEKDVWQTAYDLLVGLRKLHESKIIHRDLKSANIFFSNGRAKLGDMNISKILKTDFAKTQTGTPYYACPEVWSDKPYGSKSDVWSLGCVIYQMCCHKPPFRAANFEGLYKKIVGGCYDKIPSNYSSQLSLFISRCLVVNENRRASVDELLTSKTFRQLKIATEDEIDKLLGQPIQMLETIELPKNFKDLNDRLPNSKYDQNKPKSRVVIITEHNPSLQFEQINITRKRLPSISRVRSEKCLPLVMPNSSKLLPLQQTNKPAQLPSMKKVESSKCLRIRPVKSQKLIHLD